MSDFYYSDSCFQLELNLQETRRELIALIEACELKDNFCKEPRCCRSDTDAESKDGDTDHGVDQESPLADLLPQPKWGTNDVKPSASDTEFKYDVQSWLKSGSLVSQPDPSVGPSPRNCNTPAHYIKSPSTKTAGKSVFDNNSTVREFCLKFAECRTKQNSEFVTRKASVVVDKGACISTSEPRSLVNSYTGRHAVDAFFRSFKDARAATSQLQTNIPFAQLPQSPKPVRDYAYF